MDSLSQIVLGAAVGETVLGKKIGNKAMLWGGVAGTIPDLDVLTNPFVNEVDALAFHRGISHSIFFSVVAGIGMAYLLNWLYKRKSTSLELNQSPSYKEWFFLFFLGFLTHALLDSFTMYGTQLFAPFSDYRVAWSTIAVADFFYTIPFLFCLIVSAFQRKGSAKRIWWNRMGLIISCFYLVLTIFNKVHVEKTFVSQLETQGISYDKSILGPTILTNFLWNMTVESEDVYYQGQYSIFDKSAIKFSPIQKNHNLIAHANNDRTIKILKWFTKEFYNIVEKQNGNIQFNDLRYGTFRGVGDGENDYIFRFELQPNPDGSFVMREAEGGPAPGEEKQMLKDLFERIKGI